MRALVCPGQGSQKKGFLSPWLEIEGVREHLERLSEAAGIDLIHYGTEAEEETIKDTAIAQPLIVAAGIVTYRLALRELDGEELIFAATPSAKSPQQPSRAYSVTKTQCVSCACAPTAWRKRQPPPRPAWLQYSAALKKTSAKPSTQHLVAANSNGGGRS